MSQTLAEGLRAAGATEGYGLRFLDRQERPTHHPWSEVLSESEEIGRSLLTMGLSPGERVAMVYPTGFDFFRAFFGCQLAGLVPVPLYPPVRLGRLGEYHKRTGQMLRQAGVSLVLTDKRVQRILGESIALASPRWGCRLLQELPRPEGTLPPPDPRGLGLIQFSSGTTRDPRPVALSQSALVYQGRTIADAILAQWPESETFRHSGVSWLPLYHDMGLIGCVLPALLQQRDLTLLPPELFLARPASWLRALTRWKATVSTAPNFAYGLCTARIQDEELEGIDLEGWLLALNGAEPVSPGTLEAFCERFAPVGFRPQALTPVYGLSEASLAVTFSDLTTPFRTRSILHGSRSLELVSVGRPLPGFEVQIRDGVQVLSEGEQGQIWVRGPSVMKAYVGRPEETRKILVEGWLDTGDQGVQWGGDLYVVGRSKEVLILRGRNHSPFSIEAPLDGVPGIRTGCAAAVGHRMPERDTDSLLLLVEHAKDATEEEIANLPAACKQAVLSSCALSCDSVVVLAPGTLPRTSSGKIRRLEARERYLRGELLPPRRVHVLSMAGAMIRSHRALSQARKNWPT